MPQRILDLCFDASFSVSVVLVLEQFEEVWEKTYEIADKLVQSLPGRISGLYFLGNTKRYTITIPRDFKERIPGWFSENRSRVALIGPILGVLEKEGFRGVIAVIAARPPLDIGDWYNTDILSRTLFIRTSDNLFDTEMNKLESRLGIDGIKEAIENPLREISVEGKDFVPLCWDVKHSGKTEVIYRQGKFKLNITPLEKKLELHLKAFASEPPSLYVKRVKGNTEIIEGKEEYPWFRELEWKKITREMKPVVEAGISKGEYTCYQCRDNHKYDVLLCPQGDLIMKGIPLNVCAVFTRDKYLTISEWYAYPFENNHKIITREGDLYEWKAEEWKFLHKVNLYDEVSNGVWGLFHRI